MSNNRNNKKNFGFVVSSLAFALSSSAFASPISDYFNEFWSPAAPNPGECNSVALTSTPLGLPRCMQASQITNHLQALQDIADIHGNRAAGLPGYQASLEYVKSTLEGAGYAVTVQAFPYTAFHENGPGVMEQTAPNPTTYEWDVDFTYMSHTEQGDVTAPVAAVDVHLGPDNVSDSGCEPEDFTGFPAGSIALIQRGTCAFQQKAENAAAAGATGVIIFNQGNTEDRKGLISATVGSEFNGGIPVMFATYDLGESLATTEGVEVHMMTDVVRTMSETHNVIAESKRGNPNNVVMVGAHLDGVFEGPGINDNGSGSAAQLEMAVQMSKALTKNKVRFAWWGAEESGLVGSTYYVNNLSDEEKAKIKVYLNYDMVASPNFGYFIYDGDGSDFGLQGPPGSAAVEKLFEKYYRLRALASEGSEISFRSDYAQFFTDGIPFGGLFTGAEEIKTEEQAAKFGGEAGVALDKCYHQACDDITNINQEALEVNGDAMAFVTSWLSLSTKLIDEEIEGAKGGEAGPGMLRSQSKAAYDITHWGKHWIK